MAVNLRNTPIDKRRLAAEDKGFDTSRRQAAVKKAQARRGQAAYQYSRPPNTTQKYSGGNDFAPGIELQQARMKELAYEKQRAEEMRPPKEPLPDIYS